jgi:dolichol-phosphate mannosyltransferase
MQNEKAFQRSATALIGVCTYQEAANIEALIGELRQQIPDADVLVVDDNSPDGTAAIVTKIADADPQVQVLIRRTERGLGTAIVRAAGEAIQNDYSFFLNLDGDHSHRPQDLARLLAVAKQNPDVDVVVGSRYTPGGRIEGWPRHRRWMSRLVNRFAVLCLRLPVSDCSGSIRCYRVSALRAVDLGTLRCQGYALLEELLMRLHQHGSKMIEVPITFIDRQQGESKLTPREAVRSVLFMMRLAVMRKG